MSLMEREAMKAIIEEKNKILAQREHNHGHSENVSSKSTAPSVSSKDSSPISLNQSHKKKE